MQPNNCDLRGERAVDAAAEQRVREHAVVGGAEAELKDAVVGHRQRASKREAARPPVHWIDPVRLPPRQLLKIQAAVNSWKQASTTAAVAKPAFR
jgi:hypothetical protein